MSAASGIQPLIAAAESGELYTTGYWYWRLARAASHPAGGALSRSLSAMSEGSQRQVLAAMQKLPERIGLLPLRLLVPVMSALPGQVNVLTAEAVASAVFIDGTIAVTTTSDMLDRVAEAAGVRVDIMPVL